MQLLPWLVKRTLRTRPDAAGHLFLLTRDGEIRDLGAVAESDFTDLHWATTVAYRYSRDRSERSRLSAVRERGANLCQRLMR